VIALNESLTKFFKGSTSRIGANPQVSSGFNVCQICRSTDHITTTFLRIRDLKPKRDKCGHLHKTKVYGVRCGYCSGMGHTKKQCWKHGKDGKAPFVANNYFGSSSR